MHLAQSGPVGLRVDLDTVDPDVLPEAQAHHIQVVTTITEGTCQLHKHCQHIIVDSLFHYDVLHLEMTRLGKELLMMLPFLSPKSAGSSFTIPSVKETVQTILYLSSSLCSYTHTHTLKKGTYQLSPQRTCGPHSLAFQDRGSAVRQKKGETAECFRPC